MFSESAVISNYHLTSKILGHGSYGVVHEAIDSRNQKRVAIKQMPYLPDVADLMSLYRELSILRVLKHHPHIVRLEHAEILNSRLHLVFERYDTDLDKVIRSSQALSLDHIGFFLYQILLAVQYMHSANIVHRDLKPSNILVNVDCHIKICDFGLARVIPDSDTSSDRQESKALSHYMVTRWYRSPEIILQFPRGGEPPADMWSIGCIMAELFLRSPVFPGKNQKEVLNLIFILMGLPKPENNAWLSACRVQIRLNARKQHHGEFQKRFAGLHQHIANLLCELLEFNPFRRKTAEEALQHIFFESFKSSETLTNTFSLATHSTLAQESFMAYLHMEQQLDNPSSERESMAVKNEVRALIEKEVRSYQSLETATSSTLVDEKASASALMPEPMTSSSSLKQQSLFSFASSPPKTMSSQQITQEGPG